MIPNFKSLYESIMKSWDDFCNEYDCEHMEMMRCELSYLTQT
jgi:hypothetical protein